MRTFAKMFEVVLVSGMVLAGAYFGMNAMVQPVADSFNASAAQIQAATDGRL